MSEFILVHTSIDSETLAYQLADAIVSERLAACCWVSGPIRSSFWWQGKHEQAKEWVCEFKSRSDLYTQLEQAIRSRHPYSEPEIVATPMIKASASFLAWIQAETQGEAHG